jgi:hypothetical protein
VLTFLLFLLCLLLCAIEKLYGLGIGDERLVSITCFCALSGVLVMGLFDNIWYHFGLMALFFAVSSMLTHTDGAMEGRGLYET